MTTAATTGM